MKTGIKVLDKLLGDISQNILIYSKPGVEDVKFMHHILVNRLKFGDICFYLVNNKRPVIVKELIKLNYLDPREFEIENKLVFIDYYSKLIKDPNSLNINYLDKIIEIIENEKSKNKILFIDSLSSFIDILGENENVADKLIELISTLKEKNIFTVSLFTDWGYKFINKIKNAFVNVIELKPIEQEIILTNYFKITKKEGKKNGKKKVPFKIAKPGGIRIYIPKILVTGPYNAGKTSFIHSASLKAVSVDRIGTTIALDHGKVDYNGFLVDLFGTPGQERFDPILELLGGESLGIIVIIDSTKPETFVRAKEMMEKAKVRGLPYVIGANKSNLPGALPPEEIRKKMKLPESVRIVKLEAENLKNVIPGKPCKLKWEGVKTVLDVLFNLILEGR